MFYTMQRKHNTLKRVASFTTMSGNSFSYDKEFDLYVSLDGLYLARIPDNAVICNEDNTLNLMEEFCLQENVKPNNGSNGAKTCL